MYPKIEKKKKLYPSKIFHIALKKKARISKQVAWGTSNSVT